jgi:hypothetical protein
MLALWARVCVIAVTFVRAVFAGGDDVLETWLRSLDYLAIPLDLAGPLPCNPWEIRVSGLSRIDKHHDGPIISLPGR